VYIEEKALVDILTQKDLTKQSNHCIGILVEMIRASLYEKYLIEPIITHGSAIVSLEDNYYALGYDNSEITLSQKIYQVYQRGYHSKNPDEFHDTGYLALL